MRVRVTIDLDIDAESYASEVGREATREFMHAELAAFILPALQRFFDWNKPDEAHCRFTAVDPTD